jgi:hypothetical protein
MATPKVAARAAGTTSRFKFNKRYAGNDSLDAAFVSRVTRKLDGVRQVSSQESFDRKTRRQKEIGEQPHRLAQEE